MNQNHLVVIGASGFIAKNLRKHLSKNNLNLVSISRHNFKQLKNEIKLVSKTYDEKHILQKIKNSKAMIHLVGIGNQSVNIDFEMVNVEFTKKIINLCKKANISRIIYISGLGVSNKSSSSYFISKHKAEKLIINSGIDYTIFRPSYIIGKDDLFTKYLKKQLKTHTIFVPGSGNYSFQPIHINDVVKILHQSILSKKFNNKIIDLVGPDTITFNQYVKLFSKGTNTNIQKIDLEKSYHEALNNLQSDFGIDDLNILIADFKGNHDKLKRLTDIKFQSIMELLKSGSLF